jgi:hypothetical protein
MDYGGLPQMLSLFLSAGGKANSSPQDSSRKPRAARPAARTRPEVECLENRLVPAKIFVHNPADGPAMVLTPIVGGELAPNLRSAIVNSSPGDEVDLDNKTYFVSSAEGFGGELEIMHSLTVKNNAGGTSTITGQNQIRVFEIDGTEGAKVTMTGLFITGGNGNFDGIGGGVLVDLNANLTLNHVTIAGNVTANAVPGEPAQGGGIASFGTLTVISSTIKNNSAMGSEDVGSSRAQGGGIFSSGGLVTITASMIAGNTAQGGTLFNQEELFGADGEGGGMYLATADGSAGSAVITTTTFANNKAIGANAPPGGPAGFGNGGGFVQEGGTGAVSISACTFSGNQAVGGRGEPVAFGGGDGGGGTGGGYYQEGGAGNLTCVNSTFTNNVAKGGLAGFVPAIQPQQIRPLEQMSSSAGWGTGGLFLFGSGSAGWGTGGGLFLFGSGTDTLTNDTIARNRAVSGGAGGSSTAGGVLTEGPFGNFPKVLNTIIGLNTAVTDPDVFGEFQSLGHNLVANPVGATGATSTGGFARSKGDLLNLTAAQVGLGTLGFYNGGLTQTLPLLAGSLALDHGDDSVLSFLTTDQNGKPRKFGSHVDIGAFEFQVPPVSLVGRRNGPLF